MKGISRSSNGAFSPALASFAWSMRLMTSFLDRVEEIAKKKGISMAQVAVAWILSKDGASSYLAVALLILMLRRIVVAAPIVGTTSVDNLHEIIKAVKVKLTEEEIKYLEEPYKAQAVIGHF